LTVSSLRFRAGFFSCRQRSWDSPFGAFSSRRLSSRFTPRLPHLPLRSRLNLPTRDRPDPRCPVTGVIPAGSSWQAGVRLTHRPLGAPLGFRPFRVRFRKPRPGFRPASSHVLCRRVDFRRKPHSPAGTPEFQSVPVWPWIAWAFARHTAKATLGVLHLYVPCLQLPHGPGYVFTLHRVAHYC
jgi:hypothetical protein